MAGEDILNNERNPEMPQVNGGYTVYGASQSTNPSGGRFSDFAKKFTGFAKNNKGKLIGFGGLGVVGVVLTIFGSLLAGPMQIVHAGQAIGEVIDTARDITNGRRLTRNIQRLGADYKTKTQNARTSMLTRIPARNFEKKMAAAGYTITASEGSTFDTIGRNIQVTSVGDNGPLRRLYNEGGDMDAKQFRKALSESIDAMPGNKAYKYIMKKTLNKLYGVAWYQGITRMSAKAAKTIGDSAVSKATKLETWVEDMGNKSKTKALKSTTLKAVTEVAGEGANAAARVATKAVGKGIGLIPFVGDIIGGVIGFLANQAFDKDKIQGFLVSALIVSGTIATAADNIRNGNIPNTDDEGNYVPEQTYLDLFSQQYIYDDITVVNSEDSASASDSACTEYELGSQEYNACVENALNNSEADFASLDTTTSGSSFFSNTPLQAEFNPDFNIQQDDPEYYRGVPTQLTQVGEDTTAENIANEVVAAFTIVGPKDIADIFEGEFYAETQVPSDIGGTAMYGARVQQNDLSASEGASPLTNNEEVALLREAQEYLADQQMEKPFLARLFDVEDYHSGIATLSRDANWNLSDSSVTTQFANVFRTFAAIPNLVAKSFGTYTRAASATSIQTYNYGFNMVAYTIDQVDEEPDYWDAETFLLKDDNLDHILTKNLEKCTGATISKDSNGIKVAWDESESYKMTLSGNDESIECVSYYDDEANGGETFDSFNADGEPITRNGDAAVRAVLANYKVLASYAATSFDELTDDEIEEALDGTDITKDEAEKSLIQDMKDIGVNYSTLNTSGGSGDGNIVEATSNEDGLECFDCVVFVNSVYTKAGKPTPLVGAPYATDSRYHKYANCEDTGSSGKSLGKYAYCNGFEPTTNPVAGDVMIWADRHVGIYLSETESAEGNVYGKCVLKGPWSYPDLKNQVLFLHYTGG